MRSTRFPAQLARIAPLLALCLSFGARACAAPAPLGPDVWSVQLDGGLFAPIEGSGANPSAGMRYGKHFTSHLQGGMLTGWSFKRAKLESTTGDPDSRVELARVDANLVPVMGYMQVDLADRSWLVPFFGFGVGYEWLMLHSLNHQTGEQVKARYANVAWQTYAGIGLQLNTLWRLNSELYYNGGGSLERKVTEPDGTVRREAIDVDGVGIRVGLDMKFD